MFIGCLDLKTGHLAYSCGGHNPPLLIGQSIEQLPVAQKLPVGVISGMKYEMQETQIASGATLLLYTDGLTEAMNANSELFGGDRMTKTVERLLSEGEATPKSIICGLTDAVKAFAADAEQSDDLTMMTIRLN
jgi:sigma-B regulation protein RsbU (phosphoserine phosphatase)